LNLTYLVERDGARVLVRRPPPPALPPSAHDMVRVARVQTCLHGRRARAPDPAVCEDQDVIGAPCYVVEEISRRHRRATVPPDLDTAGVRAALTAPDAR
jgi:aminoglycoside phosphotransferase (APT) family kinase protein